MVAGGRLKHVERGAGDCRRATTSARSFPWHRPTTTRVESNFGQNLSTSSAGAVGWMQFEPGTWALYGVTGHGTIVAIGAGQITSIHNAGWPNGTFIEERLSSGPYAGKDWYYAEDITPTVRPGQTVTAGEPLGQMFQGSDGIETGWSVGTGGTTLAESLGQQAPAGDPGDWSSAAGASASRLLQSLGTPPGVMQPGGPHGTMLAGYP
jgi:hypothetical protein